MLNHSHNEEIELSQKDKRESRVSKSVISELSKSMIRNESFFINNNIDPKTDAYEKFYYLATLSLKFENYEESVKYVEELIKLKESEMAENEKNLFLSAFKYFVAEKRTGWRNIFTLEGKEKITKLLMNEIKMKYEDIIIKTCDKLISLINNYVLDKTKSDLGITLFTKVKADHYRYMAEITRGQTLYNNKQNAFQFYKQAYERASKLDDLDPIKLGVALNYSVFLYEILNMRINSIFYAKEALTKALLKLKQFTDLELEDENLKEALTIVELLNVNVHDWYREETGQKEEKHSD